MDMPNGSLSKDRARILLVEDDPGVRRSMQLLLQANGFEVRAFAAGAPLLADQANLGASCFIADYKMADLDGIEVLRQLRGRGWNRPAILITAFPSGELAARAKEAGFSVVMEKPLRQHKLLDVVERLIGEQYAG